MTRPSRTRPRRTDDLGPRRRAALALAALLCFAVILGTAPDVGATEPAVDDNELIVGASPGLILVPEATARDRIGTTFRVGLTVDAFIGLLKRGTTYLDIELALGLGMLWLGGGDGFVQSAPTGRETSHVLPGAHLRANVRALPWDHGWAPTLLVGLQLSFWAAPAVGSFARIEAELGLGLDVWRTRDEHAGVELVYGLPLLDELPDEPGSPVIDDVHRLSLRATWGF